MKQLRLHTYYIIIPVLLFLTGIVMGIADYFYNQKKPSDEIASRMKQLDEVIEKQAFYTDSVQLLIDSLDCRLGKIPSSQSSEAYILAKEVYHKSKLFSFEMAKRSAEKMVDVAYDLNDNDAIAEARTLRACNYARAGFFHEALDSLNMISLDGVGEQVQSLYYIFCGRVLHDLADYTHDETYTPYYNNKGNEMLQRGMLLSSDSLIRNYARGKIALKQKHFKEAMRHYLSALEYCDEKNAEMFSIIASTLAYIYRNTNDFDKATLMYVESCKADIKNGFRDVVSLRGLAEMFYYNYEDIDRSSDYINLAVENAKAYGTRSRINSMGSLMPLFVGHKIQKDDANRRKLLALIFFVMVLMILLAIGMKKYQNRNNILKLRNSELDEANRMKETYLGLFLDTQSELSLELNNFAVVAGQKLKHHQYDALKKLLDEIESKHNKAEVLRSFDRVFLSLFPTFVTQFNSLLLPENVMFPKTADEIPPMMRIFALVRLGITDNNRIARALDYSYNTVHNYRVRVRNMSPDPQSFEEKVMCIG